MEAAGTSGWGLRCNAHVAALHSQIEDMESQGFSFRVLAFKVVGHVIILYYYIKDAQSPSITTNYQLPIRLQNIKERKEMEKTLELAKK